MTKNHLRTLTLSATVTATLLTALTGCGDDATGTGENPSSSFTSITMNETGSTGAEPTTTGDTTTGDLPTTTGVDPTHPDGSASDSATGTDTGDQTTGEACAMTCSDIMLKSHFFNLDDFDSNLEDDIHPDPCEKFGNEVLTWGPGMWAITWSEKAGALCKPFDKKFHATGMDETILGSFDDEVELAVRCGEFLKAYSQIPSDHAQNICPDQVEAMVMHFEKLQSYQTNKPIPAEILPNGGEFQAIATVEVGSLKPLVIPTFMLDLDSNWSTKEPPCKLTKMWKTQVAEAFFDTVDEPIKQVGPVYFPIPEGTVEAQHTILSIECIISGMQAGTDFYTDGMLVDFQEDALPQVIEHNLYVANTVHHVLP